MRDHHAGKHSHAKGTHREAAPNANEMAGEMERLAKRDTLESAKLLETFLNKTDQKQLRRMEAEIKKADLQSEHLPVAQFIRDKKSKEITQIVFESPWKDDTWASQSYCRDSVTKNWRHVQELHRDKPVPNFLEIIGKGTTDFYHFWLGKGNPFDQKRKPEDGPGWIKPIWDISKSASNPPGQ